MGSFLLAGTTLGVGLLSFLPFVLRADLFFDLQSDKVGCFISLYGILKILGGYLCPCPNGIAFHISQKKALIFSFRQMGEEQKGFLERHGLRLRKVATVTQVNAEYFFPFYSFVGIGKLLLLFPKKAPKFYNRTHFVGEENVRVFARLTFSTFLAKELFLNLKYIFLKGVNAIWQKKKSAI